VSSLPPTLVGFQSQLEQAIRRERSRRSRRRVLRVALAGAAAVAVVFGVLSALPGDKPSLVERAAAAFALDGDTIFHYEMVGRQTNPDGSAVTWRHEAWQDRSEPFAARSIQTGSEGVSVELASVGERTELYDAQRNTIYVGEEPDEPPLPPRPRMAPGPRPGTSVVTVRVFKVWADHPEREPKMGKRRIVMSTEKAKRIVERSAAARSAAAEPEPAEPYEEPFRREILALLRSGAVADGPVMVDGREALRMVSRDGNTTYFFDPETYAPIELRTTGNGGGVTLTFVVYEELPRTEANLALVSLTAQHPSANIIRDQTAYRAAELRLFPNG
jgi:hypothetical protein